MKFVFFGTPEIAVASLRALCDAGLAPEIVVTQPDRPAGRGNVLTPPPVKTFALKHGIEVMQIESVTEEFLHLLSTRGLASGVWDCFVLVAFGMILPQKLLDIPRLGTVNMHPSLLPKLRGPSPIRSSILTDQRDAVGVTVMLIDHKMDHGPILAQRKLNEILNEKDLSAERVWPIMGQVLDTTLADAGGKLLAETVPKYVSGEIAPREQNHADATYCKFIRKTDAEINLEYNAYANYLKICAYDGWPAAYTFMKKGEKIVRMKITSAHLENGNSELVIDTCIPEGKKEMLWKDFVQSL